MSVFDKNFDSKTRKAITKERLTKLENVIESQLDEIYENSSSNLDASAKIIKLVVREFFNNDLKKYKNDYEDLKNIFGNLKKKIKMIGLKKTKKSKKNQKKEKKTQLFDLTDADITKTVGKIYKDISESDNTEANQLTIKLENGLNILPEKNNIWSDENKENKKDSTDDEIIEIFDEHNVEIEVLIENNKIGYTYDRKKFNVQLYNEFEYPLTLNISEKGLYNFSLSNKIKGDGHCAFHCMNVITKNTLDGHMSMRTEIGKFYQRLNRNKNFAKKNKTILNFIGQNELLSNILRVTSYNKSKASYENWGTSTDFSVCGYLYKIRFLIYCKEIDQFNPCWTFYKKDFPDINKWPLVLINFSNSHFEIITNVSKITNNLSSNSKTNKNETNDCLLSKWKEGIDILNIIKSKKSLNNAAKMLEIVKILNIQNMNDYIKENQTLDSELEANFLKLRKSLYNEERLYLLLNKKKSKTDKDVLEENYKKFVESVAEQFQTFFNNLQDKKVLKPVNDKKYKRTNKRKIERRSSKISIEALKEPLKTPKKKQKLEEQLNNVEIVKPHDVGEMSEKCPHCSAIFWKNEFCKKSCCHNGKAILPELMSFPPELQQFFCKKGFRNDVRIFNSMFAFATFQADITTDKQLPILKVQGQVHHIAPTSLYGPNQPEKKWYCGQIYMYDPDVALQHRTNLGWALKSQHYIKEITNILEKYNPYIKQYKTLKNVAEKNMDEYILYFTRGPDKRVYNKPVTSECAAIIVSKDGVVPEFDLCVYPIANEKSTLLPKLSAHIDPMVFPLLFPNGDLGWTCLIMQEGKKDKQISALQYYSYRLMYRNIERFNPIYYGSRLHQQYVIHAYIRIENQRLNYFLHNQNKLRIECYQGLVDHVSKSALNNPEIYKNKARLGRIFVLPSTFIGSPRHMQQLYQDAIAIVRKYGRPDLFITMTCNPKWPEIKKALGKFKDYKLEPIDAPLLIVRIFHLKMRALLNDILKKNLFGTIIAYVYTIEFQKRGLPHAHMLFTIKHDEKLKTAEQIDNCISAEIPTDGPLKAKVIKHMIHGPHTDKSPCFADTDKSNRFDFNKQCSKKFPKKFIEQTEMTEKGYPKYRRRDNSGNGNNYKTVDGNIIGIDNSMVVPYNPYLLMKYDCHINVEYCTSVAATKYIHKYIHKGHDRAKINFKKIADDKDKEDEIHDEIQSFVDSRYVGATEASWRILELPLSGHSHSIFRLPVHLENLHNVVYEEGNEDKALKKNETALTAYFDLNANDPNARNILYKNIPEYYRFDVNKTWIKRKKKEKIIGRIFSVSPKDSERFYLKMLLNYVPGATCYNDLKTFNGEQFVTFRDAAVARQIVHTEKIVFEIFDEAVSVMMPFQLRLFFATYLIGEQPPNALEIWDKYKNFFCEGFSNNNEYRSLLHISSILEFENFTLKHFNLPEPDLNIEFIESEKDDNNERMAYELEKGSEMKKLCNIDQLNILEKLLNSILNNSNERIFFIDGPGGTGKTFLYNCLIHYLMGNNKNVITVAWTGIASILLPKGTTSHRAFKLPIEIDNYSACCVKTMKDKEYLYNTDVIIWDEASMILGRAVEMVDELLKDICKSKKPFGGKFVIFGGDFRQVLPVVKYATPAKIVNSTIKSTLIWSMCTKLELTKNMRTSDTEHANWLLNVGNGTVDKLDVRDSWKSENIIKDIYGDSISLNEDISDRIIIACHNDDVRMLNEKVLNLIEGETHTYLSIDVAKQRGTDQSDEDIQLEYQVEYLNSLNFNGFPVHKLKLKIGFIVMLLRNLSIKDGLCNGTRLQVVKLYKHLIAGKIITGSQKGEIAFIPRIKLDTGDTSANKLPFILERRQFPITLAFSITINKSQGQSFEKVGIYVDRPLFSHGQLYVALSRCKKKEGIKIQSNSVIENVVWKEIL